MVAIAIPLMIALGFWQLDRLAWKEDLLADLQRAPALPALDLNQAGVPPESFRRASITCRIVGQPVAVIGRSMNGRTGYSYRIPCASTGSENSVLLDLGWAPRPDTAERVALRGRYEGLLVDRLREGAAGEHRFVLIPARPVLSALEASAPPQIGGIPNNHRAYAVQWFAFAGVLALIYWVFVKEWRQRRSRRGPERVAPPPPRR